MTKDEQLKLQMEIAREIWELPGVGWWRRKSVRNNTHPCHEPCGKDDHTPDYPQWKASPGYATSDGGYFALPPAVSDLNMAVMTVAKLRPKRFELSYEDDHWKAVIWTSREARSAGVVKSGPLEAPAEAIALAAIQTARHMKTIHFADGQPCTKCGYSVENYGHHFEPAIKCTVTSGPCDCGGWHVKED